MNTNKEYILHQYLNGKATEEEIEILKNDATYASFIKIADATTQFNTPTFNSEENLNEIKSHLKPEEIEVRPLFSRKQFLRIAAVIALIATSYLFLDNRDTSIHTDIAQKENFLLPDESEVNLNAKSSIVFNKKKWDNKRYLKLDGEAYFKVKKGSTFKVETPIGDVTVLGTQFNVFARDNQFKITCYEGLVSVSFNNEEIKVPAGNYVSIENNELVVNAPFALNAPTWVNNESSFENILVKDVILELERQYPIKVNTELKINKRFTGSFTHTNLNVALRSICDPLQLDFTIANDVVTLYAKNSN